MQRGEIGFPEKIDGKSERIAYIHIVGIKKSASAEILASYTRKLNYRCQQDRKKCRHLPPLTL